MKKILIVGGSGFIGYNLLKNLSSLKKHKIYSTIHKNSRFIKISNVKYFKGDLLNKNFCRKITKNIDEVYMCAAFTAGAKVIEKNPMRFLHDNTIMNMNILSASSENKIKKFIFISSSIVYPNSSKKMSENDVNYKFFSKYHNISWMKIFTEKVCEMYKNRFDILIIRPSNIFGPYDKFDLEKSKVIPSLINKFEKNNAVEVWGNGKELKDFIFIDDFINILLLLTKVKRNYLEVNVASGKNISVKEIVKEINSNYTEKKIKFISNKFRMIPVRKINTSKMKNLINYQLKYDFKRGIEKTISWYKKNKKFALN